MHAAVVALCLWFREIYIRILRVIHQTGVANGCMDQGVGIFFPRFQQQDLVMTVATQAVGQQTSSGTGTDDDEIILIGEHVAGTHRGDTDVGALGWPFYMAYFPFIGEEWMRQR